ncbi:hypothetical protein ACUHMQ_02330, partial [Chitinimonas sp. PSY-7]|uniref:hypothetical protein n=1 Tax=Chitinimonas sp. PSY-7 TaxID=3459088 RepID=UPI00403FECFB
RQYLRADIQGDGRDDWVEVYQDAQGIEHLRNAINRGDGNWDWGSDVVVGKKAQSRYLAADLNGDGRTDVVQLWKNEAGQAVATTWLSDGNGYIQGSDSVLGAWRDEAVYRLADQDGDHRADLVGTWVEEDGRQVIASWRSDGVQFVQRGDWRRDTRFIEGDFNGDGRLDLLEIRHEADGKAVGKQWLAGATGYTEGATLQLGDWHADTQYLLGDVSGDGKSDLVAVRKRQDGKAVATIRLTTADGMGEATELELGAWVAETRYLLGDGTGDGKADLWVVSLAASANRPVQACLWLSDGKTFKEGATVTSGLHSDIAQQYQLADINGDGRKELTVSRYYAPTSNDYVLVFFASEDGTLTAKQDNGHVSGTTRQYLKVDIQGDGRDDWVEVYQDAEGVEHLRNAVSHGNASWNWAGDVEVGKKAQSRYLAADLNGDGRTDVVQLWKNEAGQAVATAWLSNGTGYTQGSDSVLGAWRDDAVYRLSDQDGDHRADLVGTWVEEDGRQVIASWRSDGVQFVQRGDWRRDTRFIEGDFNGDGRMDLLEIRHESDGKAVGKQWLAGATGYTEGATLQLGEWHADTEYLLGDVSGDGKSDLVVVRKRQDGKAVATIRLATADGLGEAT